MLKTFKKADGLVKMFPVSFSTAQIPIQWGTKNLGNPGLNVCYNESVHDRKQTRTQNGTVKHDIFLQMLKQDNFFNLNLLPIINYRKGKMALCKSLAALLDHSLLLLKR